MGSEGTRPGDIVWTEMTDDFDGPGETKRRRTVVLKTAGERCLVIAISSKLGLGNKHWHIRVPHSNNPETPCCTTLTVESVAKLYWFDKKQLSECEWCGALPLTALTELLRKADEMNQTLSEQPKSERRKIIEKWASETH